MVQFNARVARIKHAQCDLSLKGTCSKYEHEADHKRRLHLKEVNQLKYDFRLMQVSRTLTQWAVTTNPPGLCTS